MPAISVIEKTFYAICRYWGNLNASLAIHGSIRSMQSGIDSADLNMVWSETPLAASDAEAIEQVKQVYHSKRLPFWYWVFPSAKTASTIDILKGAGLSFRTAMPCMLLDLNVISDMAPDSPAITIRRVDTREDLKLWREISFAGFDFPPETQGEYERFTGAFDLQPDCPHQLFLAYANGKPVATSILLLTDNAAGIYFVTTLAEHRKKGIGLQLTQATMRYAKMAGARYASLQSSPDGLPVYERAGFKEYCRVDVYSL